VVITRARQGRIYHAAANSQICPLSGTRHDNNTKRKQDTYAYQHAEASHFALELRKALLSKLSAQSIRMT
jgi:hypothetical protein